MIHQSDSFRDIHVYNMQRKACIHVPEKLYFEGNDNKADLAVPFKDP